MRPVNHRLRTRYLMEVDCRVLRVLEPVKPPETATAKHTIRQPIAVVPVGEAAISVPRIDTRKLLVPTIGKGTYPTTRHSDIEMVVAKVSARISDLNNHLLAGNGGGSKCKPVRYVNDVHA